MYALLLLNALLIDRQELIADLKEGKSGRDERICLMSSTGRDCSFTTEGAWDGDSRDSAIVDGWTGSKFNLEEDFREWKNCILLKEGGDEGKSDCSSCDMIFWMISSGLNSGDS